MEKLKKHDIQNAGFIYTLFRNSCKLENGYKKDLGTLGRDLRQVHLYLPSFIYFKIQGYSHRR